MTKETRQVTQYKFFTVIKNYSKKRGYKEISYREPIAIFDDNELAGEYIVNLNHELIGKDETITYEIDSNWTEVEPTKDNFNLPFNPEYISPKPKKAVKVAGLDKLNKK